MAFKLFEEEAAKRRAEFMAHVSPEVLALVEGLKALGRRLSRAEWEKLRMNSYERRLLVPLLDDEALCHLAASCIEQGGSKAVLGEFELATDYNDAVRRELAPLLVERLRALSGLEGCRFPARVMRVNTDPADPPRTTLMWNGWDGDVHEEAFPLQDAEPGEMVEIVVLRRRKP